MDIQNLEHALKFGDNEFPIQTDSYLNSQLVPEFKIQEDQDHSCCNFQLLDFGFSVHQVIEQLNESLNIIDTSIDELIREVKEKFNISLYGEKEMCQMLKKTKLILKRDRAKKRHKKRKAQAKVRESGKEQKIELKVAITEEEKKRKKNRISAQISRDKKKKYYNNLVLQNEQMKKEKINLQKTNYDLKNNLVNKIIKNIQWIMGEKQEKKLIKEGLSSENLKKLKKEIRKKLSHKREDQN